MLKIGHKSIIGWGEVSFFILLEYQTWHSLSIFSTQKLLGASNYKYFYIISKARVQKLLYEVYEVNCWFLALAFDFDGNISHKNSRKYRVLEFIFERERYCLHFDSSWGSDSHQDPRSCFHRICDFNVVNIECYSSGLNVSLLSDPMEIEWSF